MKVRMIVKYNEKRMREEEEKVKKFDEGIRKLEEDIMDKMREEKGIGIKEKNVGI